MIVYLFRFDPISKETGDFDRLYNFLTELSLKFNIVVMNYHPSKNALSVGIHTSIFDILVDWIKLNIKYKFEFEEHQKENRCLAQFDPAYNTQVSVQYLLPLFSPESYLIV